MGHAESLAILPVGRLTYEADSALVTPETIYDLASLTKVVATTTAAMILTERGQIALDKPVAGYIPEFTAEFAGDDNGGNDQAAVASSEAPVGSARLQAARGDVTARHLLAHTSGLPAYEKFYLQARKKSHVIEEALGVPLEAEPGERRSIATWDSSCSARSLSELRKKLSMHLPARDLRAPGDAQHML